MIGRLPRTHLRMLAIYAACAGLSWSGGCAQTQGKPETAEPMPTAADHADARSPANIAGTAAQTASDPAAHMEANFLQAERARDALVFGRLQDARSHARALRDRDQAAAFPGTQRHFLEAMRQHADEVVLAGGLMDAGLAIGRLGVTCGNCHHQSKAGPQAEPVTALPWKAPPEPVMARMLRHDIGVLQMWQGLTAPSDKAWHQGAITLTRAPLEAPQDAGEDVGDRAHAAMERIRELARAARVATTHAERGDIYGGLIAECAACHLAPPR